MKKKMKKSKKTKSQKDTSLILQPTIHHKREGNINFFSEEVADAIITKILSLVQTEHLRNDIHLNLNSTCYSFIKNQLKNYLSIQFISYDRDDVTLSCLNPVHDSYFLSEKQEIQSIQKTEIVSNNNNNKSINQNNYNNNNLNPTNNIINENNKCIEPKQKIDNNTLNLNQNPKIINNNIQNNIINPQDLIDDVSFSETDKLRNIPEIINIMTSDNIPNQQNLPINYSTLVVSKKIFYDNSYDIDNFWGDILLPKPPIKDRNANSLVPFEKYHPDYNNNNNVIPESGDSFRYGTSNNLKKLFTSFNQSRKLINKLSSSTLSKSNLFPKKSNKNPLNELPAYDLSKDKINNNHELSNIKELREEREKINQKIYDKLMLENEEKKLYEKKRKMDEYYEARNPGYKKKKLNPEILSYAPGGEVVIIKSIPLDNFVDEFTKIKSDVKVMKVKETKKKIRRTSNNYGINNGELNQGPKEIIEYNDNRKNSININGNGNGAASHGGSTAKGNNSSRRDNGEHKNNNINTNTNSSNMNTNTNNNDNKGDNLNINDDGVGSTNFDYKKFLLRKPVGKELIFGSSFNLIKPEIGVIVKEDQKVKSGGKDYFKKYNRFSIDNFNKTLKSSMSLKNYLSGNNTYINSNSNTNTNNINNININNKFDTSLNNTSNVNTNLNNNFPIQNNQMTLTNINNNNPTSFTALNNQNDTYFMPNHPKSTGNNNIIINLNQYKEKKVFTPDSLTSQVDDKNCKTFYKKDHDLFLRKKILNKASSTGNMIMTNYNFPSIYEAIDKNVLDNKNYYDDTIKNNMNLTSNYRFNLFKNFTYGKNSVNSDKMSSKNSTLMNMNNLTNLNNLNSLNNNNNTSLGYDEMDRFTRTLMDGNWGNPGKKNGKEKTFLKIFPSRLFMKPLQKEIEREVGMNIVKLPRDRMKQSARKILFSNCGKMYNAGFSGSAGNSCGKKQMSKTKYPGEENNLFGVGE